MFRRIKQQYSGKLFCFSPPVMLATFLIEVSLALYVVIHFKTTQLTRLIALLLVFLGMFQLAEYMVCGGLGLSGVDWSRLGFIAITALPPLGLHIVHEIAGKQNKPMLAAAYVSAAGFAGYFAFATTAFVGNQCQGNYVIFELPQPAALVYGMFYYGWVLTGLFLAFAFARRARHANQRSALRAFGFGYAAFLVPTAIVNLLSPETAAGIPSIMCGFAVILALTIGVWVLPRVAKAKGSTWKLPLFR